MTTPTSSATPVESSQHGQSGQDKARVLAIGATATGEPRTPSTFRAYLDPSGHPFCLCLQNA